MPVDFDAIVREKMKDPEFREGWEEAEREYQCRKRERDKADHHYTREEIDQLFDVVEQSAVTKEPIDISKLKQVLKPGGLSLSGFGVSLGFEVLFEIPGLRWMYEGEIFSARISPRPMSNHQPGIEWYVPITEVEAGKLTGATWSRTHMLRPEFRWYGLFET